jgi:D-glycero-alpha-D-manno-heptose-7-phosphate kinase
VIVTRTPYRISFFGGGTDYPAWYRRHGGAVLGATIDKYCYLSCRYLPPFFEHRLRVVWSKIEMCQTLDEIQHPAVREVLRHVGIDRGVEIHHDGDLPARSGMGSSSSFTVGLLYALYALKGRMPSRRQLALESVYIEQERLRESVGSQDQVLAAHGGLNHIVFARDGEITVNPLTLSVELTRELNSHLMLFYTGITRTASEVAESYIQRTETNEPHMQALAGMVDEGLAILSDGKSLVRFGRLLDDAWKAKRSLSTSVSSPEIDDLYDQARGAGAIGGKLTGAGGGGFMLLFVEPHNRQRVRERLSGLLHVPFRFSFSGSQVVFFEPEQDYSAEERDRAARILRPFHESTAVATDSRPPNAAGSVREPVTPRSEDPVERTSGG